MVVDFRLGNGSDGLATIARLRAHFGREIPALIVSGASGSGELARIEASGILLLHKPLPPARLRSTLAHLLGIAYVVQRKARNTMPEDVDSRSSPETSRLPVRRRADERGR
jgi:CheY-like chemotaxis protein